MKLLSSLFKQNKPNPKQRTKKPYKPRNRFCTKCWNEIKELEEEHVMLLSKKGKRIIDFYIFHRKCWFEHFEEYLGLGEGEEGKSL